jgi:flagellar hook-basal body complex protein FliE
VTAMTIDPLLSQQLKLTPQVEQVKQKTTGDVEGADFQEVLKNAINDVNDMQNESDRKITGLLKGESKDIHGTILAVQQADTSFKLMMQVRNKIVEAYKEISRSGM